MVGFEGTISGSATSTVSFNKIKSQELFVKEMVAEKPISGSMNHVSYASLHINQILKEG